MRDTPSSKILITRRTRSARIMVDASEEQGVARAAVMECEQEIQSIKAALRKLSAVDSGDPNSLEIVILKADGLPAEAKPKVTLQISSPVEEATITEIYDPANNDDSPEGSVAIFSSVETSVATLTVSASDADIPLGSSAPHDLEPLCTINAMDIKEKYEMEVPIAIISDEQQKENIADVEAVEKAGKDSADGEGKDADVTTAKDAVLIQPICTLNLRMTFKPSPKDQKEALYELLNKTSQRKAIALENLRKISMTMAKPISESSSSNKGSSSGTLVKPSVKPGFLNKKKKEPTKMENIYQRTFGPNSMLRRGLGLLFFAKDYVIFIGAVSFFHFKGQILALPAPV